jgi:hypothetical protein
VIFHVAPDVDPWFVHETMREKQEYAERERLARRALRAAPSRGPLLYPVRRRLGLQLISLGTSLQGPALETEPRLPGLDSHPLDQNEAALGDRLAQAQERLIFR